MKITKTEVLLVVSSILITIAFFSQIYLMFIK
jgi:hypothetical protein